MPTDSDTQATPTAEIRRIAVVGAGTMGAGIAQVAAEAGLDVVLVDQVDGALDRAVSSIERNWARAVEKGKLGSDGVDAARERLRAASDIAEATAAEVVVEAIFEDLDAKRTVFRQLSAATGPGTVLASNTSSISITALASATDRPDRVIGMHFFNPVPVMRLVEVVRGEQTTGQTVQFVTALADLIGLDVCLDILRVLHAGLGDDKYRPCPLLVKMVDAGRLGRKSGRGFYVYDRG